MSVTMEEIRIMTARIEAKNKQLREKLGVSKGYTISDADVAQINKQQGTISKIKFK